MLKIWIFLTLIVHTLALHNFVASDTKKETFTNFVPPSAERLFSPPLQAAPSTKAVAPSFSLPYLAPYTYPTQFSPFSWKQYPYPYYPPMVYPPQSQYIYPGPVGQPPVIYVQRYPAPDGGNEQGGSASGQGWGSYFPFNWQQWGSNFPSWSGFGSSESEGSSSGTPTETSQGSTSTGNKGKLEKIEATETSSHNSGKIQTEKSTAGLTEQHQQQYVLLGQPQFYSHLTTFPADRDPINLNGAAKGAVSSFLFYKDQNQQIAPQKFNEIPHIPISASVAYQRFLLLSKQRSEEGIKSPPDSSANPQKEILETNSSNTSVESSPIKSSGLA